MVLARIDGLFPPRQVEVRLEAIAALLTPNEEVRRLAEIGQRALASVFAHSDLAEPVGQGTGARQERGGLKLCSGDTAG